MPDTHAAACFCGAVEIEAAGEPMEMGYCHCQSCRSYSGAPFIGFALFKAEQVRVTEGADLLGSFAKTEFSHRQFCTRCGGHLMTAHPGMDCTDIYAAKLPTLDFRPTMHLNYQEHVMPVKDGLPKLKDFPREAGGSGETIPEQGT